MVYYCINCIIIYKYMLHIIFSVWYNKPTFKYVQLQGDDYNILDTINIIFYFSYEWNISWKYHREIKEINFMKF